MPIIHPRLSTILAFRDGTLISARATRVSRHLRRCPRCQATLRFVHRVEAYAQALPSVSPATDALQRILAARASGQRSILPPPRAAASSLRRHPRAKTAALAAAVAVVTAALLIALGGTDRVSASRSEGELMLTPAAPRPGDEIQVRYMAEPALQQMDSLILRARLRSPGHEMYNDDDIPVERLAVLHRDDSGAFFGSFRMPGHVVFAALVVEDARAHRIDDRNGRLWEIMVHDADGQPAFAALEQRINDLMGRSWEEAYATARTMTTRFPQSVTAWKLQNFFEESLLGSAIADTMRAARELGALVERAKQLPQLGAAEIGTIFFRAWSSVRTGRGTALDSAEFRYWHERMEREFPRHSQLAQQYAIDINARHRSDPRVVLDSLEHTFQRLAPLNGPARNLFTIALSAAAKVDDEMTLRTWVTRANADYADHPRREAIALANARVTRMEGMRRIRELLDAPDSLLVPVRRLTVHRAAYDNLAAEARRTLFARLGRALIASGNIAAGRDTLLLAAAGAWNHALHYELSSLLGSIGDSARALRVGVKLAIDPRTPQAFSDSVLRDARALLGDAATDSLARNARAEMRTLLLQRATLRSLRTDARLHSAGSTFTLEDLTGDGPTAVILWSRRCGAAVQALPAIARTVERLRGKGAQVLFVVTDGYSQEVEAYLAERNLNAPVFYDVAGSTASAFSSFGTPGYYVLDSARRIRFAQYGGAVDDLLAYTAALTPTIE